MFSERLRKILIISIVLFAVSLNLAYAERPSIGEDVIPNTGFRQPEVDDFDYEKYIKKVKRKIRQSWEPPRSEEAMNAKASFEISPEGKLVKAELIRKSGNEEFDSRALAALKDAAPFNKVPRAHQVSFAFNYNVIVISQGSDFDYKDYLKDVQKKIKKTREALENKLEGYTRVHFKLESSGEVSQIAFRDGRGVDGFKEQVEQVIQESAPFGQLPASVVIKFSYDY